MIVFPHCKINLGLHILGKRPDGFHNLETVFYPIPLYDALELVAAPLDQTESVNIIMEGLAVEGNLNSNLVYKAYQLLSQDYALKPVTFCLFKNIPMGAGLGGGSSDGAYAITLLNQHFDLQIPFQKQLSYAAQLGSDCAYFLFNQACLAKGRGELLEPISFSLKNYWIVLVKPPIHISTAQAFSQIIPRQNQAKYESVSLQNILAEPITNWKNNLVNDFENSLFPQEPILANIKNKLYEKGALYASMSGSGSTLFGIFKDNPNLSAEFKNCFYFASELP
jgi:4-diphosphocytidyl-2-C-methyl-D-erythritol kinase